MGGSSQSERNSEETRKGETLPIVYADQINDREGGTRGAWVGDKLDRECSGKESR